MNGTPVETIEFVPKGTIVPSRDTTPDEAATFVVYGAILLLVLLALADRKRKQRPRPRHRSGNGSR